MFRQAVRDEDEGYAASTATTAVELLPPPTSKAALYTLELSLKELEAVRHQPRPITRSQAAKHTYHKHIWHAYTSSRPI